MPGVCFFFESNDIDVYSGRTIDLDAWHLASCIPGDIDKLYVVNRTSADLITPNAALAEFKVLDALPTLNNAAILVCPWNTALATPVYSFNHAVDWYVFGPSEGWRGVFPEGTLVTLPQSNEGACHSVHVATAVMFDRFRTIQWPSL